MKTTRIYVAIVCIAALVFGAAVYMVQPEVQAEELSAVALLAALAIVAELLTFALPRSSYGSIAFIPYLAAVMVVPAWPTIVATTAVKLLAELIQRREWQKRAFNVAQLTVTLSAAVLVYRFLGAEGMLLDGISSLSETTVAAGIPALSAFVVAFAVNSMLVQGVIALANRISIAQALRENVIFGIGLDLLASPIVFCFAWVYAEYGAIAAFAIWAPIVGLRQLTKTSLELEQTNQELLQLMVKSIEARDSYTSGHSRRVSDYAEVIGRAAGLSERDVTRVAKAALLHDVGKIHEKYAPILAKPDKLTPDEWRLMQQHPIDGAELVGTMTRLRELIPAIRHHHEQWDGGGYPDGIAEHAIPLEARIIALADTIDAMTSERPYRPALTAQDVRRELIRCRGRQFDPDLVDKLLEDTAWAKLFGPSRSTPRYGALSVVPPDQRLA
jgi:putative nucleotidyltransferase with HDIG domain